MPWRGDGDQSALRDARHLLAAPALPEALGAWLAEQPQENLEQIADRSLERTTHYKWFLGSGSGGYTVWLHEYKPPEVFARAVDFAASVHNHRYGFCSRVLSGALHVSEFMTGEPHEPIRPMTSRTIGQGQTMLLSHEDVHRVDRVEPRTCTLLIQAPPTRSFSTCYDMTSGLGRRVYDLQSRLPHTIELLSAVCRDGLSVG
ncbi:hypothetical protein [Thermomonospora cellulosilytica]|uniref:Cysteine dioxygenase type I n=1 Tax=Thermomonospora cellulosilytica TaxID=1411118 RepID=A0A7W3R9P9_9ACTN|nr:hypothetical protein [Thermomonospora cellulosilytica]MBA9004996.1 hypothetical protein [Thermomonospora cellulosilytica]